MKIKIDEIGIKIKITENKKMKAIVGLVFENFTIKGFRIQESEHENDYGEKLWITPPSYKGPYKWHPIFYIPDLELWKELEKKIYKEYRKEMKEYHKKIYDIKDLPKVKDDQTDDKKENPLDDLAW